MYAYMWNSSYLRDVRLGFFNGIRHKSPSPHTFWILLGGHPSTNKCKKQYQKVQALNIWEKKQTSHGYTWWNAPWMAPKPTPKPQTFQTEEIWNISSMEMRRLWNWILDPNGSCQGRIPWIKFKVSEPQIPKVDSFFSIGETQWPYRF